MVDLVADFDFFFFQAEDGIRDVERSRGLGDVYKRQTTGVSNPFPRDYDKLLILLPLCSV